MSSPLCLILLSFTLSSSLLGCQKEKEASISSNAPDVNFPDDPHLAAYKSKYYSWAQRMTGINLATESIPIRFQHLGYLESEGGITGMCRVWTSQDGEMLSRYIEVDPVFWALSTEAQKQNLIYHEFGHCSLRRPHQSALNQGAPISVMFPDLLPADLFLKNQRVYLSELFTNSYLQSNRAPQMFVINRLIPTARPIHRAGSILIKNVFRRDADGRASCSIVVETPHRK